MQLEETFDTLMVKVQAGDEQAYERLVNNHSEEILNYFYKHCWDSSTAEDLAQDVFVRLYTKRSQYKSQAGGKGYLYRIAHNLWVDYCRKMSLRKEIGVEEEVIAGQSPRTFYEVDPGAGVSLKETEGAIREALEGLSPGHREIVTLLCFQKLSYKEVAGMLDIPLGTVKSRLHNGLKKIQEHLRVEHGISG